MKQQSINLSEVTQSIISYARQHAVVICVALFSLLAGYLLVLTNRLATTEPDQASISSQLSGVPRPKIDKNVVKTIESLEARNIDMQAIFNDARDNPFNE